MKTFNEVVSQATVKDGSLKNGLAVTKLANADLDIQLSGTVSVQGKSLELGAVVAAALLPAYDNRYDTDLNQLLDLYADGYVISQQKNIAAIIASGGATSKKPLTAGSVLSAIDYRNGNIKTADIDNIQLYETITSLVNNAMTTKQDLVNYLVQLQEQLLPLAQLEVYLEKLRKEAELAAQFEALTALGFADIQQIAENTYSGLLALANASTLQELTAKSYLLKDSQVDIATATIKVVFAKTTN